MLDAAASLVMIGTVGLLGSRASKCEAGVKAAMTCHREHRSCRASGFRAMCVAGAALVVWLVSLGDATAGVIVNCDAVLSGEMAAPQRPVDPQPAMPLIRDRQQPSLPPSVTNNAGGAGSQPPSVGPSAGLAALASEAPTTAQSNLVSRLTLCSRISLPSPLEDRFFRPPRAIPL